MSNLLLDSLRSITETQAKQTGKAPRPDYAAMTDFRTLADYAGYQAMRSALGSDPVLSELFFLPRLARMKARIETSHGAKLLFSGYNYLGLADDYRVIARTREAVERYGTHAGAARMVGGEIDMHRQLECALAGFTGREDCVVGVSGYGINVSVISYLLGAKDLLIHDSYMHNSGVAGAVQSGARRIAFPHNDLAQLERILSEQRDKFERTMILVEGAYSMDGDISDLPRLLKIKEKFGCWLMVDEAHSIGTLGTTGRGLCEYWNVAPERVDITMGTLSKTLASCGGFICGSEALIGLLRVNAPGILLYSTGITPANNAAALAALEVLIEEPWHVQRLQENSRTFCQFAKARGFDIGAATGLTPIVPLMIGEDLLATRLAGALFEQGVVVHPILYPVVPHGAARFRFFITAMHEHADLAHALNLLRMRMDQ